MPTCMAKQLAQLAGAESLTDDGLARFFTGLVRKCGSHARSATPR
jgi:hypothetical protein